jgi:hypothetical protein
LARHGTQLSTPRQLQQQSTHQQLDIEHVHVLGRLVCKEQLAQVGGAKVTQEVLQHGVLLLARPVLVCIVLLGCMVVRVVPWWWVQLLGLQ